MTPVENFMAVIAQYQFIPKMLERPSALVVPWLELIFGSFVLIGFMTRLSVSCIAFLLSFFVFLLARSLVLGISIEECGCFGGGISLEPHQALMLDASLLLGAAVIGWKAPGFLSLDRK